MATKAAGRTAYLIGRLERLLRQRLTEAVVPYGLTVAQYTALSVLRARGPLSSAQLAKRTFITPQSANEMVKAMEAKRWILRAEPAQGRVQPICLTRRGQQLLERCDAAMQGLEDRMLKNLTARERSDLHANLHECIHGLGIGDLEH